MNDKHFILAEVKAVKAAGTATGEWEAVLSAPTIDRDGEVIAKGAFEPLPESIPVHAYHDFSDPVGRGQPFYEDDVLKARGGFASTGRAQEIRTLVEEGVIANMSVGFMAAERKEVDGVPTVTQAELLEASFVSVPSNREAAVLLAKSYEEDSKAGARNSNTDQERLQQIHDLCVANGAECKSAKTFTELPELKTDSEEEDDESGSDTGAEEAPVSDPEEESAPEDEDTEHKNDEDEFLHRRADILAMLSS